MSLQRMNASQVLAEPTPFDAIIDARSPSEFALDHLPGAVSWPVLDDEERRLVGTDYKQVSAFEARKMGAAMVARNIADHIDRWTGPLPRNWRPLVYCWRGGDRSGTLAWFLDRIGFKTTVLDGGYKGFRAVVRQELDDLPARFDWRVLCGKTGSGKTRLLQALHAEGAQVLDLEALAHHRGSVLGLVPGDQQPSQKAMDSAVWNALRQLDPARPVYVESESKKIGQVRVPDVLIETLMQRGRCLLVDLPQPSRLQLLLEDYDFLVKDPEHLCRQLDALVSLRGKEQVKAWQEAARAGQMAEVFDELMLHHYDPGYMKSLSNHYAGLASAPIVQLETAEPEDLTRAARLLIAP